MKLFSRKEEKVKEEDLELPPLKFPEFPTERPVLYKDEPNNIREAVGKSVEIPLRKPMQLQRAIAPRQQEQVPMHSSHSPYSDSIKEGKALFIKVDRYKDSMGLMQNVKEKLEEAKKILQKLDSIKREEDHELQSWHQDLEEVRERLLTIDRTLFG
jgi:hypothetical protein